MAEVQYVSNAQFEEYQRLINGRLDHASKMVKYELDSRLDNLRREIAYNAFRGVMFTVAYLTSGAIIVLSIASITGLI